MKKRALNNPINKEIRKIQEERQPSLNGDKETLVKHIYPLIQEILAQNPNLVVTDDKTYKLALKIKFDTAQGEKAAKIKLAQVRWRQA